jgi:hypothetical protein
MAESSTGSPSLVARNTSWLCMFMRSAFFWDFTQRRMVVPYRRFETTYRSRLQGPSRPRLLGILDPWKWDRYVVPKRRYGTSFLRCIKNPKESGLHLHCGGSLKSCIFIFKYSNKVSCWTVDTWWRRQYVPTKRRDQYTTRHAVISHWNLMHSVLLRSTVTLNLERNKLC